jgi:hypothetical protein
MLTKKRSYRLDSKSTDTNRGVGGGIVLHAGVHDDEAKSSRSWLESGSSVDNDAIHLADDDEYTDGNGDIDWDDVSDYDYNVDHETVAKASAQVQEFIAGVRQTPASTAAQAHKSEQEIGLHSDSDGEGDDAGDDAGDRDSGSSISLGDGPVGAHKGSRQRGSSTVDDSSFLFDDEAEDAEDGADDEDDGHAIDEWDIDMIDAFAHHGDGADMDMSIWDRYNR